MEKRENHNHHGFLKTEFMQRAGPEGKERNWLLKLEREAAERIRAEGLLLKKCEKDTELRQKNKEMNSNL